jgi:hypothetical protein
MLTALLLLVMCVAVSGFTILNTGVRGWKRSAALRAEGERFNKLIDMESEKVVNNISIGPGEKRSREGVDRNWVSFKSSKPSSSPQYSTNTDTVVSGEKCVVCRCWQSSKFPLCDGSHVKHNKATGDNLGPAIIAGPPKE